MRLLLLLLILLLLTGCNPQLQSGTTASPDVSTVHDDKYNVTCWIYSYSYQVGISCIPDFQLFRDQTGDFDPQDWYDEWPELLNPS